MNNNQQLIQTNQSDKPLENILKKNEDLNSKSDVSEKLDYKDIEINRLLGIITQAHENLLNGYGDIELLDLLETGLPERHSAKCNCTMAQRMIGDGCEICNPELAKQISLENLDEYDEQE